MARNELIEQSFEFSRHIVLTCRYLRKRKVEWSLTDQFMRAGTSICANICEAQHAHGIRDFVAKLEIALKETIETTYWIRLLTSLGDMNQATCNRLLLECDSIHKMLIAAINTSKEKI